MLEDYLASALWSSLNWDAMDEQGEPTNFDHYCNIDFSGDARAKAQEDCDRFEELLNNTPAMGYASLADAMYDTQDASHVGHDFWLTRNGHGAGFWDGDYGDYGDEITQVVDDNFGELNLFVLDGKVEME